jgi:phage terminase large subunit-like protein
MNLQSMERAKLLELAEALDTLAKNQKYNRFDFVFPEEGPYRRELYAKHMKFIEMGSKCTRRAFIAANRVGKTFVAAYEMVCHLTGKYPAWWKGRRFTKPVNALAAGLTGKQLRTAIQEILFGNFADKGTGLLPRDCIVNEKDEMQTWNMPGVPNTIGTALVKHVSGDWSKIEFQSYDQGWEKFQGAKYDVVWLDEEPADFKIYSECATRTAGSKGNEGIVYCTFTPLLGFSDVVLNFLPDGVLPEGGIDPKTPNKFVINATWEDVPHLSDDWKRDAVSEYSAADRDARSKGLPALGSGRVFPVYEEDITYKRLTIEPNWPRAYGMDFGWHTTAVVWGAKDPNTGVIYLYSEYCGHKVAPYVHAFAIQAKGKHLVGAADPSGGGVNQKDGTQLIDEYRTLGLDLAGDSKGRSVANNAIAAGVGRMLNMMESGTLKVSANMENWLKEFRVYRYDSNDPNKIARNQNDHLLDATRYLISCFDEIAKSNIQIEQDVEGYEEQSHSPRRSEGRSGITGY